MSPHHTLFTSRPRRRPPALLLILGLLLGLAAPTVTAAPASAGPSVLTLPFCTSSAFFEPDPIVGPVTTGTTWTFIGARSNGPFTYRYWMAQRPSGGSSILYYRNSLVAECNSANLLVSSTELTTNSASASSIYCTRYTDISSPVMASTERYVGQRWVPTTGLTPTATIRYWHGEWYSLTSLTWNYSYSYVVRC
ncbi:hypothetical protein [Micromonospora fluostatini]|uniref:hypothetical protein n=1 Tax=Micromonospora sp. JCM 30529 TaxID=3421643 RepID=UPI003D181827